MITLFFLKFFDKTLLSAVFCIDFIKFGSKMLNKWEIVGKSGGQWHGNANW